MPKRIVYYPPSQKAVEQYVQTVCEQLSEHDISYLKPEIKSGLTRFLEVAGTILAKHLTEESEANAASLANQDQ